MGLGWQELLVILGIVIVIFGGAKIAGIGKASGRAIREFKDEIKGPESATPIATTAVDENVDTSVDAKALGQTDLR
jgi:sec-independent protein translocase protein TatA